VNGDLKQVKELVRQGADLHWANDAAITQAYIYGNMEVVNYLYNRMLREKLKAI
jgi:hypothetical protein